MNLDLTLVIAALVIIQDFFSQTKPLGILPLSSLVFSNRTEELSNQPIQFSIPNLFDRIYSEHFPPSNKQSETSYKFRLDNIDLLFQDHQSNLIYWAFVNKSIEESDSIEIRRISVKDWGGRSGYQWPVSDTHSSRFSVNGTVQRLKIFAGQLVATVEPPENGPQKEMLVYLHSLSTASRPLDGWPREELNPTRKVQVSLERFPRNSHRISKAPQYRDDIVYIQYDDWGVLALDLLTGKEELHDVRSQECPHLVWFAVLNQRVALLCYHFDGLKMDFVLLVNTLKEQYNFRRLKTGFWNGPFDLKRLNASITWRSLNEFQAAKESFKSAVNLEGSLLSFNIKQRLYFFYTRTPAQDSDLLFDTEISGSAIEDLQISSHMWVFCSILSHNMRRQTLIFSKDIFSDGTTPPSLKFRNTIGEQFVKQAIYVQREDSLYSLLIDDRNTLRLTYLITSRPLHVSIKGILTFTFRCAVTYSTVLCGELFIRLFILIAAKLLAKPRGVSDAPVQEGQDGERDPQPMALDSFELRPEAVEKHLRQATLFNSMVLKRLLEEAANEQQEKLSMPNEQVRSEVPSPGLKERRNEAQWESFEQQEDILTKKEK
jgi:hypothetical protein